jgi:hypothetical protein
VQVKTLVLTALVCAAAASLTASADARAPRLEAPVAAELAYPGTVHTTLAPKGALRALAATDFWGGTYTASTGEAVTIYASTTYPVDDARAQQWADFVASLVHGTELSSVKIYLETEDEVGRACGFRALACYDPRTSTLIAPGDDPIDAPTAEAIVTHEYGHHVAAHRANNPWNAVDWGTKRWGTYEQICPRAAQGVLSPGDENTNYAQNPGEAFAETYRVLNERKLGRAETAWDIVDRLLYPDDAALAALEQDVVTPWTGVSILRYQGATKSKTLTFATPLDGTFRATVRGPYRAELLSASGVRRAGPALSVSTNVCGARTMRVRVTRVATAKTGSYQLTVTRP